MLSKTQTIEIAYEPSCAALGEETCRWLVAAGIAKPDEPDEPTEPDAPAEQDETDEPDETDVPDEPAESCFICRRFAALRKIHREPELERLRSRR